MGGALLLPFRAPGEGLVLRLRWQGTGPLGPVVSSTQSRILDVRNITRFAPFFGGRATLLTVSLHFASPKPLGIFDSPCY